VERFERPAPRSQSECSTVELHPENLGLTCSLSRLRRIYSHAVVSRIRRAPQLLDPSRGTLPYWLQGRDSTPRPKRYERPDLTADLPCVNLVLAEGFEPSALDLERRRSIQLSYASPRLSGSPGLPSLSRRKDESRTHADCLAQPEPLFKKKRPPESGLVRNAPLAPAWLLICISGRRTGIGRLGRPTGKLGSLGYPDRPWMFAPSP
jgi:hypothetical protein